MPKNPDRRRKLYLMAKRACNKAQAIDKSKLHVGTPEWEQWQRLGAEMLEAIEAYTLDLRRDHPRPH